MKLLAMDTVTERCSVALLVDDQCLARVEISANRHASLILPMVESLLAEGGLSLNGLDAVAFDRGPGSFTGLRIGAGVAQGLAFGASLPVIGVSSLEALAAACDHDRVLAALDARMGQVYWAVVARGDARFDERLDRPADVRVTGQVGHGVGSGWDAYGDLLSRAGDRGLIEHTPGCFPEAEQVARLAATRVANAPTDPASAVPVYVRERVTS